MHSRQYIPLNSTNNNSLQTLQQLCTKYAQLQYQSNKILQQLVFKELLNELQQGDPILSRLNPNLSQSLLRMGHLETFRPKHKLQAQSDAIGLLLYGAVKIYTIDYKAHITRGDTFGEHPLFGESRELKGRAKEQTCVLWVKRKYYQMLREQSIKHGLKAEVAQFQALLRLSFIRKKLRQIPLTY